MKKNLNFVFVFFILSCFTNSGCASRLTKFSIISTKKLDITKFNNYKKSKEKITGEHKTFNILLPITSSDLTKAIDNALEKVPGTVALLDGEIHNKNFSIMIPPLPPFYTQNSYIVEGTALIDTTFSK